MIKQDDDIVARLREARKIWGDRLAAEAADEIEHLRNEVEALREEIWHQGKYPD